MSSSKLALSFRLFHNGQLIREETLTQSVIKIGKVPSAHLQISDDAVSRMHAIVEVTGRDVSLIDLGSTRGSFVNGKKVNKARLMSGDMITLGDTLVELTIRDAAVTGVERSAARPPAIPGTARRSTEPPRVVSGVIQAVTESVPAVAPVHGVPPIAVTAPAPTAPPPDQPSSGLAAASPPARAIPAPVAAAAEPPDSSSPGLAAASPPARAIPAPVAAAAELPGVALPVAPIAGPQAQPLEAVGGAGATAIEVAAMLGDSVVGVKHCIDPRGGKIAPATWGLVAAGVVCLLASAIAFWTSVATAADNHDRLEAWTRIAHRPAYAFRPVRLGPAVDWIAFGGFGLAIVGLGLGIARMRRERVSPYYRIGTAPGVELAIEGAPAPAFPLVAPSGDDFVFQFAPGIDGELLQGGRATALTELVAAGRAQPSASTPGAFALAIPRHARIRARAGRATFQIAAVPRPRRHAAPLLAGIERRALVYAAGSLAVHLAIWGLLQLIPPDAATVSLEVPQFEPVVVDLHHAEHEAPVPPGSETPGGGGGDTDGSPMALPEGASGDPSAAREGRLRIADAGRPPANSRADAVRIAREAGFLGRELLVSAISDLAERSDFESGFDRESVSGARFGGYDGGRGSFGAGRGGAGLGGGCDELCAGGLIGSSGPYATISDGPGVGGHYGLRGRDPATPQRRPVLPTLGTPQGDPSYDKAIVRRYIRRSIDKIAYCYDSQLLAHPGIEGEVLINFFISPTGGVERSSGTGFDAQVARCVAGVIGAIAFPRPGDGVGVEVNYPFQFHATGH